jgi:hypothetical protein
MTHRAIPTHTRLLILLLAAAAACLLTAASAGAATYEVDTASDSVALDACTGDPADCSLRGAIISANDEVDGPREIEFAAGYAISIATPLPQFERTIHVDTGGQLVTVRGNGAYSCAGNDYAFDLTDPLATASTVRGIAIAEVCGRAIDSNIAAPTVRVGPRRADNSVSINGSFPGGQVELYRADSPAVGAEASSFLALAGVAPDNNYAYQPPVEPVVGDKFVAVGTNNAGTSRYSNPVDVPSDLTSPTLLNAVAISNQSIRIDFSEPIHPSTIPGTAFGVSVGGVGRPITNTYVTGNSVVIDTGAAWNTGEAGALTITGTTRVADNLGNELLGTPQATIFAGPGEALAPTVRGFRMSPAKLCQRKTRTCKRDYTYAFITLNKDSRVIFKVYRGARRGKEVVTFIRKLKAGRTRVKVSSTLNGRKLAATSYTLSAVAQDSARSLSAPSDTKFRVVKKRL